ncbi:uroporphyrinogen-III synthase [Elizabethkingia sp. JS20170427COW]|uniref:uroporphyrinogen-III synthase n=1 Tax=Elizabethkingia sp. JS20170427COW TaxID=2583851 RepID=UPI0011104A5D|nr:uroporphyrinogen-III synthase [Elizabethkingia sp. JS20170427COW]QCX53045.1 uroporphyrinogen-III synthase [Elizabethkingia sp. JS20170427COW]
MKHRILFTKELSKEYIQQKLGADFEVSFLKLIDIVPNPINFEIGDFHHFIITSVNTVKVIQHHVIFPKESRFYVVGDKSAKALSSLGIEAEIVAKNAEQLAEYIQQKVKPVPILHFCSSKALMTLEEKLGQAGFQYQQEVVYRTVACFPILEKEVDALVFFSPSGVESFMKNNKVNQEQVFSIGKTTQKALQKFTQNKIIKSNEENLEDLLQVIKATYNG